MNRRGFVQRVVGGVAAAVAAPFVAKPKCIDPKYIDALRFDLASRTQPYASGWATSSDTLRRGDCVTFDGVTYDIVSDEMAWSSNQ